MAIISRYINIYKTLIFFFIHKKYVASVYAAIPTLDLFDEYSNILTFDRVPFISWFVLYIGILSKIYQQQQQRQLIYFERFMHRIYSEWYKYFCASRCFSKHWFSNRAFALSSTKRSKLLSKKEKWETIVNFLIWFYQQQRISNISCLNINLLKIKT